MTRLRTLPETIAWRAETSPDRVFLQPTEGPTVSYRQLHEAALRTAGELRALGIEEGERIVSVQALSPRAFANWLGIGHLRAWDVPVQTDGPIDTLVHAVHNVEATTVLTDGAYATRLAEAAEKLPGLRRVIVTDDVEVPDLPFEVIRQSDLAGAAPHDPAPPRPWDVATVVHTSGTTGAAKAIVVPWGSFSSQALRMWPYADLTEDDAFYTYAPTYYTASKCYPEMMAMLGGRVVLQPRLSIPDFWADVRAHGVTTSIVYREAAEHLLDQPATPHDADTPLRNVMMIPVSSRHQEFRERFGVRICTGYGCSEVGNITTSGGWNTDNWASVGKVTPGTPGWQYRIVDEHDYEVGAGEVGELIVRPDEPWTTSLGYYRMPEKTAEVWRNGWFHTGDAVREDPDGSIHWIDRFSDLLRPGGVPTASYEIERWFLQHPAVAESAAVATDDGGITVFVVAVPGQAPTVAELARFARETVPAGLVPDRIRLIDALPRTQASNRIQKALLRALGDTD